jgi:hypothetical protein
MEPILFKEQIAASFRSASDDGFMAVLHLGGCEIIGGERQALEDFAVKTESWRSEPMRVKIGPYPDRGPLQLMPLLLSEIGFETLESLVAKLTQIESSPRTASISQSAEAFIAQVEKQGATSRALVILRKAFAKRAAFWDAGFRF